MARADTHTRVVGWLKVALPLMALAVLSTLFLVADQVDPEEALPYADVDVEDLAREPRMTMPSYAGTTADGAALSLTAEEARPAADGTSAALGLRLELETPDGAQTELVAATAVLDQTLREVVLSGGVTIKTSTGYTLETAEIAAKLDQTGLASRTSVIATAPAGKITADGATLSQDIQTPGTYLLVFNGTVRLVYLPGG